MNVKSYRTVAASDCDPELKRAAIEPGQDIVEAIMQLDGLKEKNKQQFVESSSG